MLELNTPSFHAFTSSFDNIHMLITLIGIEIYIPDEEDILAPLTIKALWDTGASMSAISSKTASDLNLEPITMIDVRHADGMSRKNLYKVNITLPNNFLIKDVKVMEADLKGNDFDALIGMDIITLGDFSITNIDQKTKFSFRIPSIKEIDYV